MTCWTCPGGATPDCGTCKHYAGSRTEFACVCSGRRIREAERRVVEAAKAHIRFLSAENGASSSETEGALWDTIIALAALKEARGDA